MNTKSTLIIPEVLAGMVQAEFEKALKFTGFANIDNTLARQAGDTITLPSWLYIGPAGEVAEGADMSVATLTKSTQAHTIKKAGQAVELTDEAILSGYGDPVGEGARQLGMSIADKVDNDVIVALRGAQKNVNGTQAAGITKELVADIVEQFGENDAAKVLFVNPGQYAGLLANADFVDASKYGQNVLYTGEIGQIFGLRVVKSAKVAVGEAFAMVPGAVSIFLKRDTMLENDRDILAGKNVIAANKHYVVGLVKGGDVVKVTLTV